MASRLKGMLEYGNFKKSLEEFGEVTQKFLQQYVPGQAPQHWQAKHGISPTLMSDPVHNTLSNWSNARLLPGFPKSLFVCSSISLGNVIYAPYTLSHGNGCVLFSSPTHGLRPGRIKFILQEPEIPTVAGRHRIMLIVRAFQLLNDNDVLCDPYFNNPVIGGSGAGLARLYYDSLEDETHLIEPRDLVCHIAICLYADPEQTISRSAIVILSLDLVSSSR
ncbi:hypothetical protein FS749_016143 [Ceratobasidium sp. UAMH 11750]|nr:hypothetical protein FS749_016143 [Ceratobasidium sp. UAMH 11750]